MHGTDIFYGRENVVNMEYGTRMQNVEETD